MTLLEKEKLAQDALITCYLNGGKLLVCGNGGSAADAAHITGELVKGFMKKRPLDSTLIERIGEDWAKELQQGLPCIDLTANCAVIAAIANDQSGEDTYAQQVTAYGRQGDIFLGISTSGNAENVRRAMVVAKALGLYTIALTGRGGGKIGQISDLLLNVDETETYLVQEKHLPLYHRLCAAVEDRLFSE